MLNHPHPGPLPEGEGMARYKPVTSFTKQTGHMVYSVHVTSPRTYPAKLPPVDYSSDTIVRQVRHNGEIKWAGYLVYVSEVLAKEPIGLTQIDEDRFEVRYSFHLLGILDQRTRTIASAQGWHGRGQKV